MGQVSAWHGLIGAEPAKVLEGHHADFRIGPGFYRHGTATTGWSGRPARGQLRPGNCTYHKSRMRDVQANVDLAGSHRHRKDANSSMVTNWTVAPAVLNVTVKTTWNGADGVKGLRRRSRRSAAAVSGTKCSQTSRPRWSAPPGMRAGSRRCDQVSRDAVPRPAVLLPPSWLSISAESAGFFIGLPSSTRIDGCCARLAQPGPSRPLEAVRPDMVRRRDSRRGQLIAHDAGELDGRTRLGG